ncbi:MAG: triple tyrosine motif-containing protein, partial [Kiritimatiellaeota bacterium]|nr:triple tyrosine motif-containing protein [Kiritimatiellota bacterium]
AGVAYTGLMQTRPVGDLAPALLTGLPERLPISALVAGRDGSLWVGTQGDYLWHWHDEVADPFYGPHINALLVDRTGRLLVGSDSGLKYFDTHRDELVDFTNFTGRVNALLEDRSGRIWIGTQFDGLLCLATNGTPEHCGSSKSVLALYADREGVVWVGTTAGLERWQNGKHVTLLRDEFISQILDDNRGNLWLGLRRGLVRISKAELLDAAPNSTLNLRFFGVSEGFPDAPCASGTGHLAVKTADGKLWFATRDGLAMVDPWRITEPQAESLRIFIEDEHTRGNEAEFAFTAPCFTEPETVRFSWRLEGFERDWTEPSAERRAHYPHLPPGTYQFQVRAALNGAWSQPASTSLTVAPLFWQTWWWKALLYAASAAVAVLVALGIYRGRVRRQQQLDRLRLRIARDLHDEIGSNLGGIALLIGVAEQEHDPDAFQRIRSITLQSIEALKDLVWMIDPGHDALPDMLQRLRGIADDLLPGKLRAFTVTGDAAGRRAPLEVRRNVLPIFKEALHNIIKHAKAQNVTIEISLAERRLTLTIRDDGAGMDPAVAPGGHGLRNMQRRAEEIGGLLKIESQPGKGTRIHLEVPLA